MAKFSWIWIGIDIPTRSLDNFGWTFRLGLSCRLARSRRPAPGTLLFDTTAHGCVLGGMFSSSCSLSFSRHAHLFTQHSFTEDNHWCTCIVLSFGVLFSLEDISGWRLARPGASGVRAHRAPFCEEKKEKKKFVKSSSKFRQN